MGGSFNKYCNHITVDAVKPSAYNVLLESADLDSSC